MKIPAYDNTSITLYSPHRHRDVMIETLANHASVISQKETHMHVNQQQPAAGPRVPTDDALKAEWKADANIRSEFLSEANYVAFRRAEARGVVSILEPALGRYVIGKHVRATA